jgi:hypothetical protein
MEEGRQSMKQKSRHYLAIAEDMFKSFGLLRDILCGEITPARIKRFDLEIVCLISLRQELADALGDFQVAQEITTLIYSCSVNPAYRMLIYALRATSKRERYTH